MLEVGNQVFIEQTEEFSLVVFKKSFKERNKYFLASVFVHFEKVHKFIKKLVPGLNADFVIVKVQELLEVVTAAAFADYSVSGKGSVFYNLVAFKNVVKFFVC